MMAPGGGDTGTDPENTGGNAKPMQPGNNWGFPQDYVEDGAEEKDVWATLISCFFAMNVI